MTRTADTVPGARWATMAAVQPRISQLASSVKEHAWWVLPVLAFAMLVISGTTTSSLGVDTLQANPGSGSGHTIGPPEHIRTDEYLTSTPLILGQIASGLHGSTNPLARNDFLNNEPSGVASTIVLLPNEVMRLGIWLPNAQIFAFLWWLPWLALAIGVLGWFRLVTGRNWWGWWTLAMIGFSPSTRWWSETPIGILGWAFLACAALLAAVNDIGRGRRWRPLLLGVLAALSLSREVTLYAPWVMVLVPPILLATAAFAFFSPDRRRAALLVFVGAGILTLGVVGLVALENSADIRAMTNTVYPGARRSGGAALSLGYEFGAPVLGNLARDQRQLPISTNASEISTSFNVVLVVLLGLVALIRPSKSAAVRACLIALGLAAGAWLLWTTADFGSVGASIPLVNLVPPPRAASTMGFLGLIAFGVVMATSDFVEGHLRRLVPAVLASAVTLYAGSLLAHGEWPGLSPRMVWFAAACTGLAVALLCLWPRSVVPIAVSALMVLALSGDAEPIQIGLGDLRSSPAAVTMLANAKAARADGSVWASDFRPMDALFMATGTPALTGRQLAGPHADQWSRLDPTGAHRDNWNRGDTFIQFEWESGSSSDLTWSNPEVDQLIVRGSPCAFARAIPTLRHIVSQHSLDSSCLKPAGSLQWSGQTLTVYDVAVAG